MKKKKKKTLIILWGCILIVIFISVVLWLFTKNNTTSDNLTICWDLIGSFIHNDGTATETVLSIKGNINTLQNQQMELAIQITPHNEFQYLFNSSGSRFISDNQKHGELPHLVISTCYTYNKQKNESTMTFFALDVEKKYFIALFRDMPQCYFVAAEGTISDYNQLLDDFSDFIESYSSHIWKE